ncbi:MAG: mevalonate kinase family protein [Armatimonadota bacterium]
MTAHAAQSRSLAVRSWGRICLFGEHQDYLGLPVVAAAVNLSMTVTATPRKDRVLSLHLPNIHQHYEYPLDRELSYRHNRDYLPSTINVLRREGIVPATGWNCTLRSTIPINAGTSSSSAMVVAWVKFLLAASGVEKSSEEIAILANRAEVLEFGQPGGLMDHYLSALGGVYYLDFTTQPVKVERLCTRLTGFVLGNSRQSKATTGVLGTARQQAEAAFAWVHARYPQLDCRTSPREAFSEVLRLMPTELRGKLEANLINRDLCQQGRLMLREATIDQAEMGRMLLEHHQQLSEGIGVSTPKLDTMVQAAMDAGALGGKLNGSGGGGCMYAYAPGREREVADALEKAGGKAYILCIPDGPG